MSPGYPGAGGAVVVLRALGLGDAITGIAALRGVRRRWPDREVVLAAPTAIGRWLRDLALVDAWLPCEGLDSPLAWPPGARGHVAVNLHGRGPQSHRLLRATRPDELVAFSCKEAGFMSGPQWCEEEHEVRRWCRLVSEAGGPCGPDDLRLDRDGDDGTVVVHPGAASASRRWPARRWAEVARALVQAGEKVVVTGGSTECELCREIAGVAGARDLGGRLTLPDLARLVARARLVLCGDTGVAHLATAYATRSVVLFGPTPPDRWGPPIDPQLHTVLWHGAPGGFRPGDPHAASIDPLLADISVGEVLAAVRSGGATGVEGEPFDRGVQPLLPADARMPAQ